jgi:hypothetical protein
MNRIVVRYGEGDAESTYVVNCVAFVHPTDVFLELRDDAGELLGHVRFLSESQVGFGDGDTGGENEKLERLRLLSESEVGFGDDDAGEELVRPPIIAACRHGDEEDWVEDVPVPLEFLVRLL